MKLLLIHSQVSSAIFPNQKNSCQGRYNYNIILQTNNFMIRIKICTYIHYLF